MAMHRAVELPTGPQPEWELSEPNLGDTSLKSVSESLVVLQSLRQSRSKWVTTMFPKFSVKTRGGRQSEVTPPPHTTKAHGKYDLHIGPHVFHDTAIYEVHYLPVVEPQAEAIQPVHQPLPAQAASTTGATVQTSLSSIPFPSGTFVTPALSSKVTAAAQSNPVLANLLKAVINRTATDDQVKTLGLLIQSLEGVQSLDQPNPGPLDNVPPQPSPRSSSPRPFDIVLEFHERSSDRFILPRGDAVCELAAPKAETTYRGSDLIIACSVPFPSAAGFHPATQATDTPDNITPEVVSFRISRISQVLWELFSTWAGGPQKIEESQVRLAEIAKQTGPRLYLQHRLPDGELLEEIKSAVAPSYTLKSIKPAGADSNRAKRKSVSRRPTVSVAAAPSPSIQQKQQPSHHMPQQQQQQQLPPPPLPPPVKRRTQKAKAKAPTLIACHSCGQRDVPLMMGGRFCRECINAGRATTDIPQVQPGRVNSSRSGQLVFSAAPSSTAVPTPPYAVQWVSEWGSAAPGGGSTLAAQTSPVNPSPVDPPSVYPQSSSSQAAPPG